MNFPSISLLKVFKIHLQNSRCIVCIQFGWRADGLWRRFITSLFLVTAFCLVTLIFTQSLASSSATHLTIGRTIRSWLTNEVEISNIKAEIAEVLNEQRAFIAQEMHGYSYPAGKYNISAKSLNDLLPEMGGQPIRSLVITTWRSGSTFLGDVLNSHPANFYHYEPLLDYDYVQIRGPPLASDAVRGLENLLQCNYSNLSRYLEYLQDDKYNLPHNTRLWYHCLLHPHLCWLPELLSPFCSLFPFQSMKIVQLRLRLVEQFLADPRLNVRVVLLVRDPRGTMQSRSGHSWCIPHEDCENAVHLCADLVDDYSAALRFNKLFPTTFKVVRYEDMSLQPHEVFPDIFKFFGLQYHSDVQEFVKIHTSQSNSEPYSTYRNSSATALLWRKKSSHAKVKELQKVCRVALNAWGYLPAVNASHQLVFNPLEEPFSLP